jgi:hypothetical protein
MAYPYDDYMGDTGDVLGMERLGLQRDKFAASQGQAQTMNMFRQQAARQKALQTMASLGKGGGFPGIQEALYRDVTGGHIPGATRHNELLDQDTFWRGIREQSMQRPQPQGLYRVGDEYGFNGQAMGNLSQMAPQGTSPDDYFDQIQAKHFANQEATAGAELDSNMGDLSATYRQAAAQQQAQMRRKQADEYMKGFEGRYGVNPGVAFQDFDPVAKRGYDRSSGVAHIPGTTKVDQFGEPVQLPGSQLSIPIAEREAYGQHSAFLAGFENEDEMRMRDPRYAEMRQLQQEREAAQREEEQRNIRSTVAQRSTSSLHQIRLQTDPAYRAQFMGGLGAESQQMNQALQRSPGAPQPRLGWANGSGFIPPTSFTFGY